jgi:hypothetical protein
VSEHAPGLAEAEAQLRIEAEDTSATVPGYRERRQAIASELDRLRAENAALRQDAERIKKLNRRGRAALED